MGRDLVIPNTKVSQNDFRYAVNGDFNLPIYTEEFDTCDFICQGNYGNMLFNPAYFNDYDFSVKRILKLIRRGQKAELQAMADNRIKVFADTQEWLSYYVLNNISFSFGSRIHGNIMPILAGTQSLLYARDARTREMAEFFDIPFVTPGKAQKKHIYDWYMETDYSKFNRIFKKRFDDFQRFMVQCGLVDKVNEKNIFMSREKRNVHFPESVNLEYQTKLKKKLKVMNPVIKVTEKIYHC